MQKKNEKECCEWKSTSGSFDLPLGNVRSIYYIGSCGNTLPFLINFKYCPYCGKEIKKVEDDS